jgi:hypothetical protein
MRPKAIHQPGKPRTDDPPAALVTLSERITHPLVRRTGVTVTSDGRWALYVTVPKTTDVPLPDLEARTGGFPVVYEAEPDEPLRPYERSDGKPA